MYVIISVTGKTYMAEKKHSELIILDILQSETDEDHVLSRKEILDIMKNVYGIEMDRRTFYAGLEALRCQGVMISEYEENHKGYYLKERQFTYAEVLLLCNAIHASGYIPRRTSTNIINKLLATQSRYQSENYRDEIYLPNPKKTENRGLLYNLDVISRALKKNRNVTFQYYTYSLNKHLTLRHDGKVYDVNPQFILFRDGKPYLIAKLPDTREIRHYRLDRMTNALVGDRSVSRAKHREDPYSYASNRLFMYSGELITFTARCHNSVLDYMLETFGMDIELYSEDENHFVFRAESTQQDIIWLAQMYMDVMEIIEPVSLRETIRENLQDCLKRYE